MICIQRLLKPTAVILSVFSRITCVLYGAVGDTFFKRSPSQAGQEPKTYKKHIVYHVALKKAISSPKKQTVSHTSVREHVYTWRDKPY